MADYSIDNKRGTVSLTKVQGKVPCKNCGEVIALSNNNSTLVKGVTIIDKSSRSIIAKCGKCKTFNAIGIKD